jgi:hypothetical protein
VRAVMFFFIPVKTVEIVYIPCAKTKIKKGKGGKNGFVVIFGSYKDT